MMSDSRMMFVWPNMNKVIRIKRPCLRYNRKRDKKQKKRLLYVQTEEEIQLPQNEPNSFKDYVKVKGRSADNGHKDSGNEEEMLGNYDQEEDEDKMEYCKTRRYRYLIKRTMQKTLGCLFSDAYICPRHSKRHREKITIFQDDVVCDPLIKRTTGIYIEKIANKSEDGEYGYPRSHNWTIADFFIPQHLAQLGLNSQFERLDSHDDRPKFTAIDIDKVTNDTSTSTTVDVLCEVKDEMKGNQELSSPVESENKDICHSEDCINTGEAKDKVTKSNVTLSKHALVNLSRVSLRPDNLHNEFKEKYWEAQCKNRRFVINIYHLAHQHLIRQQLLPLDIISQSDISMYVVFVYGTEALNDTDKYRVFINSNLPLTKPSEMFHELIIKDLTSIYELIHKAMEALDNPNVIRFIKHLRNIKNESVTKYPTCTFHLLWSTRLKLKLQEPPHSVPDKLIVKGQNFSIQNRKIHQGPATSSICGICLQDFNINDCFPIALSVCSHWFCEECWKLKLCAQIKNPENDCLLCIEQSCSSTIDNNTLLSILDIKLILKYFNNNNVKNMIREESNVMVCPNRSCEKSLYSQSLIHILQANKPDQFMPVKCACHRQYCYKCLESPHWPVNCDISKIYHKCLDAQGLDTFKRILRHEELPDLVLRGKSCPRCGTFVQEKNDQLKFEQCACGCEFCWPCGKQVGIEKKDAHSVCSQRFELSNNALKAKMMKRAIDGETDIQISRWFKVALTHRQMRHPQVVHMLYSMADQIASRACEVSESGKYTGDAKSASVGWKSSLRKWNKRMCKKLENPEPLSLDTADNDMNMTEMERPMSDGRLSVLSNVSVDNRKGEANTGNDNDSIKSLESTFDFPIVGQPPVGNHSLIFKAVSNIVQIKLEIHHIIEHTAVMLEFEHSLNTCGATGKIIRCLERAEDLCEALGLLLQDPHKENVPRVIPSFLRLRLQLTNMLSTLYYNLKSVNY